MEDLVTHADSLIGDSAFPDGFDRRNFLKVSIGTGFAAAVMPVAAQSMIHTDTEGLTAGTVNVTVNGKEVPVYRAQPAGKSKLPVVLVISEIFGVHEHIADVARRFAKLGYLALAPDLFVRQGDAKSYTSIPDLIKDVVSKVPDQQVITDLDAVVAYAKANGGDTERMGITGFCWGGRITWLYSAHNPKIKAGVAWYGQLVGTADALHPKSAVDLAPDLKVPVLGLYGGKDTGITQAHIDTMKAALANGNSGSEFVVFPNSGHAFHADYRPSYVEADAKEGWQKCLAWFKAHGVV
ncbi:MAG: dienelactone hydrolase family protein [Pseudomonadota bacterium]|nr:dienelactone hydrolase family protein [Pseudomonadota bacterium]